MGLLIEILLVMKLEGDNFSSRAWTWGVGSALMIVSGYYGELVITGDLTPRWMCWFASMAFFLYIVYELLVGLAAATAREDDRGQLVYIPCRLFVPNAWYHRCQSRRRYPDGLLRFRHHLQMWCWTCDLPDLVRQVLQREPLEVRTNAIGKPMVFRIWQC